MTLLSSPSAHPATTPTGSEATRGGACPAGAMAHKHLLAAKRKQKNKHQKSSRTQAEMDDELDRS
jgi:hypothetical protein